MSRRRRGRSRLGVRGRSRGKRIRKYSTGRGGIRL